MKFRKKYPEEFVKIQAMDGSWGVWASRSSCARYVKAEQILLQPFLDIRWNDFRNCEKAKIVEETWRKFYLLKPDFDLILKDKGRLFLISQKGRTRPDLIELGRS